jgi:hypothetical protein
MAIATFGMLDLSIVTDVFIQIIKDCIDSTPLFANPDKKFSISLSGDAPDTVRKSSGCMLNFYLFHVQKDGFQSNALNTNPLLVPSFPRAQRVPLQPLSLDLYYLLTAYSDSGYLHEQQAMSIAMRCLYEHPVIWTTIPFGPATKEEFSLQLEVDTADQMTRLWQAISVPLRLSAAYKVSVIFIAPDAPPPPGPKVQRINLLDGVATIPFATAGGQLTGTKARVTYRPPDSTVANPLARSYDLSPALVPPGQPFVLFGGGLSGQKLFISGAALAEVDVSAWIDPTVETPSDTRIGVRLPATIGNPPGSTPWPSTYQLRIGTGTLRSNSTPFSIAAGIDNIANPPILNAVAGLYTIQGVGLQGVVQVLLGTVALARVNAAPAAGQFLVNAAGTQIDFKAPAGLAPGQWPLRIRANDVESPPSWWVQVP